MLIWNVEILQAIHACDLILETELWHIIYIAENAGILKFLSNFFIPICT